MIAPPTGRWFAQQRITITEGIPAQSRALRRDVPGWLPQRPFELFGISYCTITVTVVLWLRLPDLAVTVAVYVPAGVPGAFVVDDPPPPHAATPNNATAISGVASAGIRRR